MSILKYKYKIEDFFDKHKKLICFISFGLLQFANCFFLRFFLYDCFVRGAGAALAIFGIKEFSTPLVASILSIIIGGALQLANIKLFEFLLLKLKVVKKKWYAGVVTGTFLVTYIFLGFWMWVFNQALLVWFCPILAYLTAMAIWTPTAIGRKEGKWYLK